MLTKTDIARVFRSVYGATRFNESELLFAKEIEKLVVEQQSGATPKLSRDVLESIAFASTINTDQTALNKHWWRKGYEACKENLKC